jgi:hypothetical protein
MSQITIKYPNDIIIYQYFPFQGPQKYAPIWIFWYENTPSGNPAMVPSGDHWATPPAYNWPFQTNFIDLRFDGALWQCDSRRRLFYSVTRLSLEFFEGQKLNLKITRLQIFYDSEINKL